MMAWLSWPVFVKAFVSAEMSDAGGLIRWPVMLLCRSASRADVAGHL
jgi:TRAP-type mannitol/chloroaromatic compound transport system permease small subunit